MTGSPGVLRAAACSISARPWRPIGGVGGDILLADRGGARIGGGNTLVARAVAHRRHDLVEPPFEVDRRRSGRKKAPVGVLERLVRGIVAQGETQAIGRDRPDHRGAAGLHRGDGMCRIRRAGETHASRRAWGSLV